jgi:hypothetical protein
MYICVIYKLLLIMIILIIVSAQLKIFISKRRTLFEYSLNTKLQFERGPALNLV